jgi:putative FmdB family regulatory protein
VPTYQYACTACDERLEVVQKFSDEPLTECPACQGRLRKVFSAVGVVFKGSGFYKTDSRAAAKSETGGEAKAGTKDGQSAAAAESKTGTKGDGKPAGGEKKASTGASDSSKVA